MKVIVDQLKCEGNGICVMDCPDVFRFQVGSKKAMVIKGRIPPALQQKCREIARNCPAKAITIQE